MFIAGVIGYPLNRTYSPLIHNTAFRKLKIQGVYYPMRVLPDAFGTIISLLKQLKFNGANITNPYKKEVLKYLDLIDDTANEIGAVNTVLIQENKSIGFNTDFYGFKKSLSEHNINLRDKNVLLIGAGGVACACAYVIKDEDPGQVFIANRTIRKAQEITKLCKADVIGFDQIKKVVKYIDVVINATSIDLQNMIVPALKDGSIYYDVNYKFKKLKQRRIFQVNGISMFIYQAALSFSLWTKKKPPIAIMKRALKGGVK